MASHAAEPLTVTDCAGGLVELGVPARVHIDVVRRVACGLDLGFLRMTQLATERWIDSAVANQAVGHLRVVDLARHIALPQTAMTSFTGVLSFQKLSNASS